MQILTYFSLLPGRGHEAAATAALQAQERSRSPAKICCRDAPSGGRRMRATILLPRRQSHNPPGQQHHPPGRWEGWNLPTASLQTSPQDGKGTGTKPWQGWTLWVDGHTRRAKVSMRASHRPRARETPEGRKFGSAAPPAEEDSQFYYPLSHTFLSCLLRSHGASAGQSCPSAAPHPAGWSPASPAPDPSWNQWQDSPSPVHLRTAKFSVHSQKQSGS